MKSQNLILGGLGILSVGMLLAFQNCSVRRMDGTISGDLGSSSLSQAASGATVATGSTGSGSSGTGSTGSGSSSSSSNSCTAAPTNPVFTGFTPTAAMASQDASVYVMNTQYAKSVTVTMMASSACFAPNHSCAAATTTSPTPACKSQKISMISISFKCSADPTSTNCDLINPGDSVDLTNATTGDGTKNLSISFVDMPDSCAPTTAKTFMTMDYTTFKNIGGKVTFNKVDGTASGKHLELQLDGVKLKTQSGSDSITISGTYAADITCVTKP